MAENCCGKAWIETEVDLHSVESTWNRIAQKRTELLRIRYATNCFETRQN